MLDALLAGRAEQHPGEGAMPAAADDEQLRVPPLPVKNTNRVTQRPHPGQPNAAGWN
ncbi:MAG: hypothetical protein ACM3ML_32100 [Micromonosporaceae bacterium]